MGETPTQPAEPTEPPTQPTPTEVTSVQPPTPEPMPPTPALTGVSRPKNGLGAASLVLGVSSLVALLSFFLFPLAFLGGLVGVIIGIVALLRVERGTSTNRGQSIAGITCSGIALIIAVVFAVRTGTWVNDNRGPLRRLGSCITKAADSQDVGQCFSRFSVEITNP